MADFDSSLPIRSEADGLDQRVHVKMVDYSSPSGLGKQVEVADGNVHTYVNGKDAGGVERLLKLSEGGHVINDGVYDAVTNTDPSNIGLVGHVRGATPADADQTERLTAIVNGTVHALDVALHNSDGSAISSANPMVVNANIDGDYNAVTNLNPDSVGIIVHDRNAAPGVAQQNVRPTGIANGTVQAIDVALHDAAGAAFSPTNPMPVYVTGTSAGTDVLKFSEGTAIAQAATHTYSYTPTATKTLTLQRVFVSGSGKVRVEIKLGTTSSELTKVVMFNSTANPNCVYEFSVPQSLVDTESVVVNVLNGDKGAQNVYVTIEGVEN
jgi:hypothetical protein